MGPFLKEPAKRPRDGVTIRYSTDFERHRILSIPKVEMK
jgi:hypothetical protein